MAVGRLLSTKMLCWEGRWEGRREDFKGRLLPLKPLENVFESAQQMAKVWRWAGCYLPKCWQWRWEGCEEGFKGRLVPEVAF
jgi:hypothetical protein